ncbi:MAG: NADH-quinone oxidoreductase subunit G [Propionibacteriaceae bacterium]
MSVDAKNAQAPAPVDEGVTLSIDGVSVTVPKGSLVIRAAEQLGIDIPRFCDHPLLDPMGACRQCLVEIPDQGNGRGAPKPQTACTTEAMPGMVVETAATNEKARKFQEGILELLLINHPLDCPVCDKGGECPLQNQVISSGRGESRYGGVKRTYPKPVSISQLIMLDRERCVLCARCTRFSEQISGDPFIALVERGALQQVGMYEERPYTSYFSGNVAQICPVGALTSADYRFQARPFDLVSTASTCEHCASGCSLRVDHRHYDVKRRLAGNNPDINEEWSCDKGRFGFFSMREEDRLKTPLVREDGELRPASWAEAIDVAVRGLQQVGRDVGILTGGRLTLENAYGYSKFARVALKTNNIDLRSRPFTAEETDFLGARVAGQPMNVTYADLENAKHVVLVGFEPEEESPIVFLRLRKAVRKKGLVISTIAPFLSTGATKLGAKLITAKPGAEAQALRGLELDADTIILVGERAALAEGTLSAAVAVADAHGANMAWIPRRAGEIGAIEAGCLPTLLPGGRPVADAQARIDVAAHWSVAELPAEPGLDAVGILGCAGIITSGIEAMDFADPGAVLAGLDHATFVVALEQRLSEVAQHADVVFPVAAIEDQAGTFLNWEHRAGAVNVVNTNNAAPMTDLRVLAALADGLGAPLGIRVAAQAAGEFAEFGPWEGARVAAPKVAAGQPESGLALATWRLLLDNSRLLDGATFVKATAKPAVARLSAATATKFGVGETVTVSTAAGSLTLPVEITAMSDDVVWLPGMSGSSFVTQALRAVAGDAVTIEGGAA